MSRKPTPGECSYGEEPFNRAKNRYGNKLPCMSIYGISCGSGEEDD